MSFWSTARATFSAPITRCRRSTAQVRRPAASTPCYGFCNMLWKLIEDMKPEERPTHLAVVFDKSEKTFRNEMYPDYKAHRPDAARRPDPAIPADPRGGARLRHSLPRTGRLRGRRPDRDLRAASPARPARPTTIVSSDKDLMQLVDRLRRHVRHHEGQAHRPRRGDREIRRAARKVIEVQALIGDSTDNVPGVPGIGVEDRGAADRRIRRPRNAARARHRDQAGQAPRVADRQRRQGAHVEDSSSRSTTRCRSTCRSTDLAVHEPDYKLDRLPQGDGVQHADPARRRILEHDAGEIDAGCGRSRRAGGRREAQRAAPATAQARRAAAPAALAQRAASNRPTRRPPRRADPASRSPPRASRPRKRQDRPLQLRDRAHARCGCKHWIARAHDTGVVAVDTETTSLDPMQAALCGFSLAVAPNEACYVPLGHRQGGERRHGLFARRSSRPTRSRKPRRSPR